jgi:hypothetical protein
LKSFANPSPLIKLTMEGVIVLLTNKQANLEWAQVKTEFNKGDFLEKVLNFNVDNVS